MTYSITRKDWKFNLCWMLGNVFRVTNRGRSVIDLYGMLPLTTTEPVAASVGGYQETGFAGHVPVDSLSDLSFAWNIVNKSDHKWLNATIRMRSKQS